MWLCQSHTLYQELPNQDLNVGLSAARYNRFPDTSRSPARSFCPLYVVVDMMTQKQPSPDPDWPTRDPATVAWVSDRKTMSSPGHEPAFRDRSLQRPGVWDAER